MIIKTKVFYTKHSKSDLDKLENKISERIVKTIRENSHSTNPLERAKALKGVLHGYHRYRIGNYRAIFDYNENGKITIITVMRIKHRKDVFR